MNKKESPWRPILVKVFEILKAPYKIIQIKFIALMTTTSENADSN